MVINLGEEHIVVIHLDDSRYFCIFLRRRSNVGEFRKVANSDY